MRMEPTRLPIKAQLRHQMGIEPTKIEKRPLDPSIFKVADGFQKTGKSTRGGNGI